MMSMFPTRLAICEIQLPVLYKMVKSSKSQFRLFHMDLSVVQWVDMSSFFQDYQAF
jgi:hypothetical protein